MKAPSVSSSLRSPRTYVLGLLVFLGLLALSACGGTNSVGIYDNARVLNASQVKNAASKLPNNVDVYTVNNFTGTNEEFRRATAAKLRGDPNRIVVAIDTTHRYTYIVRGAKVPLSSAGISQAVNSFATNYGNGDYTNATVAALGSMSGSLNTSRAPSFSPILLCCLPLLLLGLLFFMMSRARRPGIYGRMGGFGMPRGPYQQPLQPGDPYNQGGYGPGGYGYGPPNQRGGMNPWAAGGLGAAAGGLAGYELGKMQGERGNEAAGAGGSFGPDSGGGDYGAGGNFGGGPDYGSGGDYGAGGSFGGGGADYGSGEDFGGGGSFGGYGGGGSFGGDDSGGGGGFGGGGDFGGGGGFDNNGGGGNF